jgi:hypothetical protein
MRTKVTTLDVFGEHMGLFLCKIGSCLEHRSPGPVSLLGCTGLCLGVVVCEFFYWFLACCIKLAQIALKADTHLWAPKQRVKLHDVPSEKFKRCIEWTIVKLLGDHKMLCVLCAKWMDEWMNTFFPLNISHMHVYTQSFSCLFQYVLYMFFPSPN